MKRLLWTVGFDNCRMVLGCGGWSYGHGGTGFGREREGDQEEALLPVRQEWNWSVGIGQCGVGACAALGCRMCRTSQPSSCSSDLPMGACRDVQWTDR